MSANSQYRGPIFRRINKGSVSARRVRPLASPALDLSHRSGRARCLTSLPHARCASAGGRRRGAAAAAPPPRCRLRGPPRRPGTARSPVVPASSARSWPSPCLIVGLPLVGVVVVAASFLGGSVTIGESLAARDRLRDHRPRRDRRLPPPVHPPQLHGQPRAADRPGGGGQHGFRRRRDQLGGHSPAPPCFLRPLRRSALAAPLRRRRLGPVARGRPCAPGLAVRH